MAIQTAQADDSNGHGKSLSDVSFTVSAVTT